jgi:hypothetical protein
LWQLTQYLLTTACDVGFAAGTGACLAAVRVPVSMSAAERHTPTASTDARPQMCIRPPKKSQLSRLSHFA